MYVSVGRCQCAYVLGHIQGGPWVPSPPPTPGGRVPRLITNIMINFILYSACMADPSSGFDLMHDYMYNYTYCIVQYEDYEQVEAKTVD